jgi:transposase
MKFNLTTNRIKALQKAINTARQIGKINLVQRCSALLCFHQGAYLYQVAEAFAVSTRTISRWIVRYLSGGIDALNSKKSKGRPSRLTKTQKKKLLADIELGPEKCGYSTGVWSSALIQDHIARTFRVSYSTSYISELLRNLGCRYSKPKFHYTQEPKDYATQLKWIREDYPDLYARVKEEEGLLFFQDESTFQMQTNTAKTWNIKGQTSLIERNPKRGHIKIYGAIELFTGELTYSFCKGSMNQTNFTGFLQKLWNKYAPKKLFIICDNATYHGGQKVRYFLNHYIGVELVKQPKRSPHLNPIEKLWKEIKQNRTHNRYFQDVEELRKAVKGGLCWFQRNKERVKSLMAKWGRVGEDPKGALAGTYDSSFIPQKQIEAYNTTLKEKTGIPVTV